MPRPHHHHHHPPPPPPPPLPILLPVAFLLSLLALFLSFYLLRLLLLRLRLRRSASASASAPAQGIDAAAVEAMFPVAAYGGAARGEGLGEECAVCLTALGAGDGVRVLRGCGHVFHPGCIDPWLKARPTCPVCRSTVRLI
ncbi:RING-H2 finger protein ATL44 [Ananas comosus]|uniref:RING-type E3 ubiquitin transferase n=1 Tax=Ananas comosus TaxID=4615 RepID=A0A199UGV8_ANACO|nr:RING-H2 finger protein ATL44 [Ananas comosus]